MPTLMYCKKCGRIVLNTVSKDSFHCDCCKSITYRVPTEYLNESLPFLLKGKDNSETKQKLYDELVKPSPEFDQYLFDHRDEILARNSAHFNSLSQLSVTCPYCSSTNTKKITATSKAVNTALFGIFGTKRHKQWHCNKCGSDF